MVGNAVFSIVNVILWGQALGKEKKGKKNLQAFACRFFELLPDSFVLILL
jgi:hypothetical protein